LFGSAVQASQQSFANQCATRGAQLKSDELQVLLAEYSLADTRVRQGLISLMQKSDNRCRASLERWLTEIRDRPMDHRSNTGRIAAVTLGVLLELPVARQLVEAEAASGGGVEWLATLRQWDDKAYHSLLSQWIQNAAVEIRRERGLSRMSAELYGKNQISDAGAGPSKLSASFSPVVLDLFLKSVAQRKPTREELSALNALFVNFSAGARSLYSDSFIRLLRKNAVAWMAEFRTESAWTQFQLMELMGKTGGAEMVRELMWLSQNHNDMRMKSRAAQVLDEATRLR